jgi:hypothetical protein
LGLGALKLLSALFTALPGGELAVEVGRID